MITTIWPLLLVIAANSAYHLIANKTPAGVNPFLSLVVTYAVGMFVSLILYLWTRQTTLQQDLTQLSWTSFALGLAVVGLEGGFLMMYRAGWAVSVASLTANLSVAVILLLVGVLILKEGISVRQLVGMAFCVAGLVLVNFK